MQFVFFTVDRKFSQTKTFSQKAIFMFCLEHVSLKCIIKYVELKVNDPLKKHGDTTIFAGNVNLALIKHSNEAMRPCLPAGVQKLCPKT